MKKSAIVIVSAVIILCGFSVYLITYNIELKRRFRRLDEIKKAEAGQRLSNDRLLINTELEEKYRRERIAYEAMAKQLEMEKKRVKELEQKDKK